MTQGLMQENLQEIEKFRPVRKTIAELAVKKDYKSVYNFFIPDYQRGYRWKEQQVLDLLNDINDFRKNKKEGEWYCLQPVVVKEFYDIEDENKLKYEVIDGQQRLTTIFLILLYLNAKVRDDIFSISYQTRQENDKDFWKKLFKLKGDDDEEIPTPAKEWKVDTENIDYYYLSSAYITIAKWFENNEEENIKSRFLTALKDNTEIIWYEPEDKNPIEVFARLNTGKIRLTDSELIKALFLSSSNFVKRENKSNENLIVKDGTYKTQFEIANEWDEIEYKLRDDRFWYFLAGNRELENRIELIFEIMASLEFEKGEENSLNNNKIFRHFYNLINKTKAKTEKRQSLIVELWKKVKSYYERFCEWFEDNELYHKIGFILCVSPNIHETIKELCELAENKTKTRTEFKEKLTEKIKNLIVFKQKIKDEKGKTIGEKELKIFEDLDYDNNPKEIKSLLLLYNILPMFEKAQDEEEDSDDKTKKLRKRFPFDIYKNTTWNLEHIASQNDKMPETLEEMQNWFSGALKNIEKCEKSNDTIALNLANKIREFLPKLSAAQKDNDKDKIKKDITPLFEEVIEFFYQGLDENIKDGISNLALLDEQTNKSYGNSLFPDKRAEIALRDKNGVFIPECTKRAFFKYLRYEETVVPMLSFWVKEDMEAYKNDIENVLGKYLTGVNAIEETKEICQEEEVE